MNIKENLKNSELTLIALDKIIKEYAGLSETFTTFKDSYYEDLGTPPLANSSGYSNRVFDFYLQLPRLCLHAF